jgi:DNA repair protein RecN (Recombination protein N)
MIRFLRIENLAIVDELELEFESGLTVLTGETGAGKSVIVGALGLLVGNRATNEMVRTGEDRARIDAIVEDHEGQTLKLRREVSSKGRSRSFIDDKLVPAGELHQVGQGLFDLHGQHDHQALLDRSTHLNLLDTHGGLIAKRQAVAKAYNSWRSIREQLDHSRQTQADKAQRLDLLTFQRDQIDGVAPMLNEDSKLESQRTTLVNVERLSKLCEESYDNLYEQDDSIISQLGKVWRALEELSQLDPEFKRFVDTRDVVESQLEELSFFLRSYKGKIDDSPERLAAVEARLAVLEGLKRKYGPSLGDVIRYQETLLEELATLELTDKELEIIEARETESRSEFLGGAEELSLQRRECATELAGRLRELLAELGIPDATFVTQFSSDELPEEKWSQSGVDEGEFFFSANPGETVRPLARVASGGELSRVMLALKTLAPVDNVGKTLLFDEVDAGVGGKVAAKVGALMERLSSDFQVICVTHLPQIAACGDTHLTVTKIEEAGRTVTRIESLAEEGRVKELAKLMTGQTSASARAGAMDMREANIERKRKAKAKGEI